MSRSGARKWVTRYGIARAKLGRRKVIYDLAEVVEIRDALWEPPGQFVAGL